MMEKLLYCNSPSKVKCRHGVAVWKNRTCFVQFWMFCVLSNDFLIYQWDFLLYWLFCFLFNLKKREIKIVGCRYNINFNIILFADTRFQNWGLDRSILSFTNGLCKGTKPNKKHSALCYEKIECDSCPTLLLLNSKAKENMKHIQVKWLIREGVFNWKVNESFEWILFTQWQCWTWTGGEGPPSARDTDEL